MNLLWKEQLGNKNHISSDSLKYQIHLSLKNIIPKPKKYSAFPLIINLFNAV
jgi:hypothetical protein